MANPNPKNQFQPGHNAWDYRIRIERKSYMVRLTPELAAYAETIGKNRSDGIEKAIEFYKLHNTIT